MRNLKVKKKLMQDMIQKIGLSLNGYVVLTELGTNDFALTPILAHMSGAQRVIVWTRDTKFGTANEAITQFQNICTKLELNNIFEIRAMERPAQDIREANLITNLAMLRPLDAEFLSHIDPNNTAVSLMYDAWELREQDIDIEVCRQSGIRLCGVNESDPDFPIFKFIGPLAAKMVFMAGYEIMGNDIVIWSNDDFGLEIESFFQKMGANTTVLTSDRDVLLTSIPKSDFIFFASYHEDRLLISRGLGGIDCVLSLSELEQIGTYPGIIHLYGAIDPVGLADTGFTIFPQNVGFSKQMTQTLAEVGNIPMLRLMAAGLRAGQEILNKDPNRFAQEIISGAQTDE
jgi:hypothetical protein